MCSASASVKGVNAHVAESLEDRRGGGEGLFRCVAPVVESAREADRFGAPNHLTCTPSAAARSRTAGTSWWRRSNWIDEANVPLVGIRSGTVTPSRPLRRSASWRYCSFHRRARSAAPAAVAPAPRRGAHAHRPVRGGQSVALEHLRYGTSGVLVPEHVGTREQDGSGRQILVVGDEQATFARVRMLEACALKHAALPGAGGSPSPRRAHRVGAVLDHRDVELSHRRTTASRSVTWPRMCDSEPAGSGPVGCSRVVEVDVIWRDAHERGVACRAIAPAPGRG